MARRGGGAEEGALEVAHVGGDRGGRPSRSTGVMVRVRVRVRVRRRGDGGERGRADLEEAGAWRSCPRRWLGVEVVAGGGAGELLDNGAEVVLADVVYLRRLRKRGLTDLLALLVGAERHLAARWIHGWIVAEIEGKV